MINENIKQSTVLEEQSPETLKKIVRDKYADIARNALGTNSCGCCGTSQNLDYSMMNESYQGREGYNPDADLALGCGIPTDIAKIQEGDVVLDLGSGAGNDVFVARSLTGPKGWVIGVDLTEEMIEKARDNNKKLGFSNVEFRLGDIENLPVQDNEITVVISNCVLNLVPDKSRAFSEIFRVLKPGGHFSISDIVSTGNLPPAVQRAAELYAGCVAGAINRDTYLSVVHTTGFTNVRVAKEREIYVPDEVLASVLSADELREFRASGAKILSVTVYAEKMNDTLLPKVIQYYNVEQLQLHNDISGVVYWAVGLKNSMLSYFEVEPFTRFEAHHHENEQITLVLEGTLYFETQEGTFAVGKGEVIAIPANTSHAVFTHDHKVRAVDAWSPPHFGYLNKFLTHRSSNK